MSHLHFLSHGGVLWHHELRHVLQQLSQQRVLLQQEVVPTSAHGLLPGGHQLIVCICMPRAPGPGEAPCDFELDGLLAHGACGGDTLPMTLLQPLRITNEVVQHARVSMPCA